jgi:hypothetical protein
MTPLRIGPEFDQWVGQTLPSTAFYAALTLDPPLAPGEEITWLGMDPQTGHGLNALLACYHPDEGESCDVSLAVYEKVLIRDAAGHDRGTARHPQVLLELVYEAESPDRLRVIAADASAADQERPLVDVLRELRAVLDTWPSERANRLASRTSDLIEP